MRILQTLRIATIATGLSLLMVFTTIVGLIALDSKQSGDTTKLDNALKRVIALRSYMFEFEETKNPRAFNQWRKEQDLFTESILELPVLDTQTQGLQARISLESQSIEALFKRLAVPDNTESGANISDLIKGELSAKTASMIDDLMAINTLSVEQMHVQKQIAITIVSLSVITLMAVILLLLHILRRRVVSPIVNLEAAAQSISQGHFDESVDVSGNDEVASLASSFDGMRQSLKYRLSELTAAQIQIQEANTTLEQRVVDRTKSIEEANDLLLKNEQDLRAAAHFEDTHTKCLTLFSTTFDRHVMLNGFLSILADNHPYPVLAFYSYDEWTGHFRCEASYGLNLEMSREFSLGEGLLGEAAQLGKSVDLDTCDLKLETGLADFTPSEVLMLPISYQELRLGVLVLASNKHLQKNDRVFLDQMAAQVGVALNNLKQYADLKLLAERLRASSVEIEAKNMQLEVASRMKTEFLANMSHELRTPLNAIIGFSEILKDGLVGELDDKQKEYIGDIFTSGNLLLSLINDILDLSKVEAGKMALELEAVIPGVLVQQCLPMVKEKALAHNITLSVDIEDGLGEIWLDQRKAKQILFNMLSNAAKFTPDGGEVSIIARKVGNSEIENAKYNEYLKLSVADTGIGISADDQKRLFQPFTQIDSSLSRHYQGTGLGLVMIKRLTEVHGGQVGLVSEVGKGSTFTVWIPWRTEAVSQVEHVPVFEQPMRKATSNVAKTALIIEDDDVAAELLRVQLEEAGFIVKHAASAEIGLEAARKEVPSLITLDIMLPGMSGWEFLEQIKHVPELSLIPVVIISMDADTERGLALGAASVLHKPVSHQDLLNTLQSICCTGASLDQSKILVVDDDPKAVQLFNAYLEQSGYNVLSAYGGAEAIELARTQHPNLIVLDLMMPEINGFDVVKALQQDDSTANIPIIVVTAKQVTTGDREKLKAQAVNIIEKSEFNNNRFMVEVRRALMKNTGATE